MLRTFDSFVDNNVETALKVTTVLKQIIASPVADIVTALIPGEADDLLKKKLLIALEKVTDVLTITDECMKHHNVNDKLACFAEQMRHNSPELQDALLHKMASLLTSELDGNRMKQNLYDLYTQAKYAAAKQ